MLNDLDTSQGYRIKAVSKFTGLSPHAIRKWEERYQLLTPFRSKNGYRLYFEDDLQFLMYVKSQIGSGRSIGQLFKIGGALIRRQMTDGPVHVFGVPPALHKQAITLIQAARRLDRSITEGTIQNLVDRLGLEVAIQQVFFPVLKTIGDLWHSGQICITGEHMVTQAIRRHLVETLRKRNTHQEATVIIACAPHDFHEIGAMTATLILQNNGWQPVYLGTDTDIDLIRLACKRRMGKLIIISMVREPDQKEVTTLVKGIKNKLAPLCPIIVGGHGACGSIDLIERYGIKYFEDFNRIKQLKPRVYEVTKLIYGSETTIRKETVQ